MARKLAIFFTILVAAGSFAAVSVLYPNGTTIVIKVNGAYGIIDKGTNQGIQEGQTLSVTRRTAKGATVVGQVRVIRTTANRAAVEITSRKSGTYLKKGDELYPVKPGGEERSASRKTQRQTAKRQEPPTTSKVAIQPITEPAHNAGTVSDPSDYSTRTKGFISPANRFHRPWVGFNVGAMVPNGDLAVAYSTGVQLAGSYMVATGRDFNIGLEISQSFVGDGAALNGAAFSDASSSMFSARLMFQKFFGDYVFFEGGGGIFRPKITVKSIDQVETSYTSTHFGLSGGAGFFVPTSPYAGFMMKGRLNNYFDDSSKHYFGISGGFRFKIR